MTEIKNCDECEWLNKEGIGKHCDECYNTKIKCLQDCFWYDEKRDCCVNVNNANNPILDIHNCRFYFDTKTLKT